MFWSAHDRGVHEPESVTPHWLGVPPPPHVAGATHGPHWMTSPQPSPAGPQVMFCSWHVSGTQLPPSGWPQAFATPPPPHVAGEAQGLQKAVMPPQPSACGPQVLEGKLEQAAGVHAPPSG